MKVTRYPNNFNNKKKTLILGSFSAIHNGHMKLIEEAKKINNPILFLIIENPSFLPNNNYGEYEELDIRLQKLSNIGIEYTLVLKMDKKILGKDGEIFLNEIISNNNVKNIIIGKDFAMGKNRGLTSEIISKKFNAKVVDFVRVNETKLSSKIMFESIEIGDVQFIKTISPFSFWMNIQVSTMGKIKTNAPLIPHPGIYASYAVVNEVKYWSIISIDIKKNIYAYIPDLLIDKKSFKATIEFRKKIRSIVKEDTEKITEDDKLKSLHFLKNNL